jgi:hypothetical protein
MYISFFHNSHNNSLKPVSLGLKEEDTSPTRNAYKVRSYQVALAAIYQHDKPIRSGQEAIEVCPQYLSPSQLFHSAPSYVVSDMASQIG